MGLQKISLIRGHKYKYLLKRKHCFSNAYVQMGIFEENISLRVEEETA
jgi:hypothetical protein